MITLKKFTEVFNLLFETQKYFDNVEKAIKIHLFETPAYENCFRFFEYWVDSVVKKEFIDTVSEYLWPDDIYLHGYERPEHPLELFYKDGAVNKIGTIEQLYNYIKENDGFRTDC